MYSQKLRDHFDNPQNVGSFDKNDNNVGTGLVGAPACGDVMKLQIKVEDGVIQDARLNEAKSIKNVQIAKELSLPPVKIHCSVLAEDSIKAAIKDYESKYGRN